MLLVAMGIFIFGAIGLAIDGAQLYAQRQLAQAAADAAAQAAMMSIFAKTNDITKSYGFPTSHFVCSDYPSSTPCRYALHNGFDVTKGDVISLDFNSACAVSGLEGMLANDPVNVACATASRSVDTTLMRLLGPTATTVSARGIAATLDVVSPVPIIVTHPTLPDALYLKGTGAEIKVKIIGGPEQSIQVNSTGGSSSPESWGGTGNYGIDLSEAGPDGTGGDFGVFGPAPGAETHVTLGTGEYRHSAPITDPLASVCPPGGPGCLDPGPPATSPTVINSGVGACPAAADHCTLYYPGSYSGMTFNQKTGTALFMPGLYYITNNKNFEFIQHGNGQMAVPSLGCTNPHPETGCGMVVAMAPGSSGTFSVAANAGTETGIYLQGDTIGLDDPTSVYKGILFFDRNAASGVVEHDLQGGGTMMLTGTIYLETTAPTLTHYQSLGLGGNPGSTTTITGMIIADTLFAHGNPTIRMLLNPYYKLSIRKVALVH